MSTSDHPGDTPILATHVPGGGALPDLDYGPHVSRPGWSG